MFTGSDSLPALPMSIIKETGSIIEMLSKLHQVIPGWVPTAQLSLTQSQMTGPKTPLQAFLQNEVLVPSGRAFLALGFMGTRPWFLILPDRSGIVPRLRRPCSVVLSLCSDCFLIIWAVWGGRSRLTSQQAGGAARSPLSAGSFITTPCPLAFSPCPSGASSPAHLWLLVVVPLFIVLLVSCSRTLAGRKFWLGYPESRN